MSRSPAAILYDENGNPVTVVPDGASYRLLTEARLASINLDAFARLRVSEPRAIFDSKQIEPAHQSLVWAEATTGGSSLTYNQARASTLLTAGNVAGDTAERATRRRWNYQPGRSFLVLWTFAKHHPVAGVTKRSGYFGLSDGIFLETADTSVKWVIRSSVTGTTSDANSALQAAWNVDTLDGSGGANNPSGILLDLTAAQIGFTQFEWLGVGTVTVGFFIDGAPVPVHTFQHANAIQSVYMSSPNQTVRYKVIRNSGTAIAELENICCAVFSEGGQDPLRFDRVCGSDTSPVTLTNKVPRQCLKIRMQAGKTSASIAVAALDILLDDNVDFIWYLIWNPPLTGADNSVWHPVKNSSLEFDYSDDRVLNVANDIFEECVVLDGGHELRDKKGSTAIASLASRLHLLGEDLNGVRDEIGVIVHRVSGSSVDAFVMLKFEEAV